jgi:hypothetical protein
MAHGGQAARLSFDPIVHADKRHISGTRTPYASSSSHNDSAKGSLKHTTAVTTRRAETLR